MVAGVIQALSRLAKSWTGAEMMETIDAKEAERVEEPHAIWG
jgi:hypothetical protein